MIQKFNSRMNVSGFFIFPTSSNVFEHFIHVVNFDL